MIPAIYRLIAYAVLLAAAVAAAALVPEIREFCMGAASALLAVVLEIGNAQRRLSQPPPPPPGVLTREDTHPRLPLAVPVEAAPEPEDDDA